MYKAKNMSTMYLLFTKRKTDEVYNIWVVIGFKTDIKESQ